MRINKFVALASGVSRRKADLFIKQGRVLINSVVADLTSKVDDSDVVSLDGLTLKKPDTFTTIILNKPAGYICSKDGQGGKTVYELLPDNLQNLKTIGRLDKDSSGLILLSNDGDLAQTLTHPSFSKVKIYEVTLDKALTETDAHRIEKGIELDDGASKLKLKPLSSPAYWRVTMSEGRNRQIRRTFEALDYRVIKLHRTNFGSYKLGNLKVGEFQKV